MRIATVLVLSALLFAATVTLVAPSASAGCMPQIKGLCVRCPYGYEGDGCIVTNPCDPRNCVLQL